MQRTILIAFVATAIAMASCEWFTTKQAAKNTFNMQGNWQLDSISNPDTTKLSGLFALAIIGTLVKADSVQLQFNFTTDSVVTNFSNKVYDTTWYEYNAALSQLKVKEDTAFTLLAVAITSDSTVSLTGSDSTTMYLKRK